MHTRKEKRVKLRMVRSRKVEIGCSEISEEKIVDLENNACFDTVREFLTRALIYFILYSYIPAWPTFGADSDFLCSLELGRDPNKKIMFVFFYLVNKKKITLNYRGGIVVIIIIIIIYKK